MSIEVEVVDGAQLGQFRPHWERLWNEVPTDSFALLWEWWETLAELPLAPPVQWLVFRSKEGQEVVGMLPFCDGLVPLVPRWRSYGVHLFATHFGWPAHLDLLVEPQWAEQVVEAIFGYMKEEGCRWFSLRRIQETSPYLGVLRKGMDRYFWVVEETREFSARISLAPTEEEFLGRLTKTFRKKVLYKERRLAREFTVDFGFADSEEAVEELLSHYLELHQKRMESLGRRSNLLEVPYFKDGYFQLARKAWHEGRLRLACLKLDGTPKAVGIDLRCKDTIYFLTMGFDPTYAHFSLGNVLTLKSIRAYIAEGVQECDFLPSYDWYKFMWADGVRYNVNWVALRPSPRAAFYGALVWLYDRLRYLKVRWEYRKIQKLQEEWKPFLRRFMPPPG